MPTAYSYVRMSTVSQALRGESAKRQIASTRAYCEQNGLTLDESFRLQDSGISAFRGKNAKVGALSVFLQGVESGRIPSGVVLIVESLDRISREDVDQALQLFLRIIQSGVDIVTLTPERRHSKNSIKDIVGLIEPIIIMSRANEESSIKSERVSKDWAKRRRESRENGRIVGRNTCPWWLRLQDDRFVMIPDHVSVVRQVYQWKADGYGISQISAKLNAGAYPKPKSEHWAHSALAALLRNRMVLGEYQPHRIVDGRRVPDGLPIEGYYPAIITSDHYHQVQAVTLAKTHRGRTPKNDIINPFTGLLFNANDGFPVYLYSSSHIRNAKRYVYQRLYSLGCFNNVPGADRTRINFAPFEDAFFKFVRELDPKDFAKIGTNHDAVAEATGRLAEVEHQIQTIKSRMKIAKAIDHYLDLLDEREVERKLLVADIERFKALGSTHEVDVIGETRTMLDLIRQTEDVDDVRDYRCKVKARIHQLISRIVISPKKLATRGAKQQTHYEVGVLVEFHNGMIRAYSCDQDGNLVGGANVVGKPHTRPNGKVIIDLDFTDGQVLPTGTFDIEVDPDDPDLFYLVPTGE